ncbi:hypothetical protein MY3296_003037 [Beauveria thailandica]
MKIEIIHLVLLGLSSTCLAGPPPGPGKGIKDAIIDGLKDWGPAGSLKPPAGQNPPIKNLPGSVPSYHKPHDPNEKTGVTRVPGKPLGPAKKCRPCLRKRQICCDSGNKRARLSKPIPKRPSRVAKGLRPARMPTRFRAPKSGGKAAVVAAAAPYLHKLLDALKNMDGPIGQAVTWLDDVAADIQYDLGGPQRSDIYGNELKHKVIKGIGNSLQLGFETTYDRNQRLLKEADVCEEARRAEEAKENDRIYRIDRMLRYCDPESNFFLNTPVGIHLQDSCKEVTTRLRKKLAQVVARAWARKGSGPEYWIEECRVSPKPDPIMTPRTWNFQKAKHDTQCDGTRLPVISSFCGAKCRAVISLASYDGE